MIRKILFFITSVLAVGALQGSVSATTASIPVELTVPETLLQVEGRAAPNTLVTIKESGSVVVSTTADSSGFFQTVISRPSGIHTISVEYVDRNSIKSQTNTQTISLQPQQTYIHTVFLSPTISRGSSGNVVNGSIVQFRGYTIPNAQVTLRVDYNGYVYDTISDAEGFYEFLIDSSVLGDGSHIANVSVTSGASLSDPSRSITFQIEPKNSPSTPDIIVKPQQLPPPIANSPNDGAVIDGNKVIIYGESIANAQINIYENNQIIGTVFANEFGEWNFEYTAISSPVTLSFEACINGKCSVLSRTLTLIFNGINTSCKINFELDTYRFWGILVNQEVILKPINVNSNGVFYINWGDGTNERFDYNMLDNKEFRYKYKNKGNYNGKITYKISDNDQNCQRDRYFAVLVDTEDNNNDLYYMFLLTLLIAGLLILHYLVIKEKQKTVQSN